jgi:hypothetical protein
MSTNTEPDLAKCQDCCRVWDLDELRPIQDLGQRVAPGEPMPSGECADPECGALCQPYEDDYVDQCPSCGRGLYLVECTMTGKISVMRDGWAYDDGPLDSSDERFACDECGSVPGEWVFKRMERKQAAADMAAKEAQS